MCLSLPVVAFDGHFLVTVLKCHPGIDGTCGWAGELLTLVDPTSCSGCVVGLASKLSGGDGLAATGKDMWSLGHTPELVSEVGSTVVGVDACSSGLTLMLVAVYSICVIGVSVGTATSVLYNFYYDNGTKPPLVVGEKSLDVAEVVTEEESECLPVMADVVWSGKVMCSCDVYECHSDPACGMALVVPDSDGACSAADRVYGVNHCSGL